MIEQGPNACAHSSFFWTRRLAGCVDAAPPAPVDCAVRFKKQSNPDRMPPILTTTIYRQPKPQLELPSHRRRLQQKQHSRSSANGSSASQPPPSQQQQQQPPQQKRPPHKKQLRAKDASYSESIIQDFRREEIPTELAKLYDLQDIVGIGTTSKVYKCKRRARSDTFACKVSTNGREGGEGGRWGLASTVCVCTDWLTTQRRRHRHPNRICTGDRQAAAEHGGGGQGPAPGAAAQGDRDPPAPLAPQHRGLSGGQSVNLTHLLSSSYPDRTELGSNETHPHQTNQSLAPPATTTHYRWWRRRTRSLS